ARRYRGGVQLDNLLDAGDSKRLLRIEGFGPTAIDRTALDRGVLHPGNHHVDAVGRPPAHDVGEIDDRNGLADITPRARRLEAQLHVVGGWQRQVGRYLDEFAEAQPAPGGLVDYRMVLGMAARGIDVPHARRRLFEQLPRYRAGLAQRLIELPHAARPIGVLVAIFDV